MKIWAVIAASVCSIAHAAWDEQFSGLWLSPALPGWAVSIHQQGDHAVATILTYGPDGKAKWYQAPDLTLPPWSPYILWGMVSVGGELLEGGGSRKAGSVVFNFDDVQPYVLYTIDGISTNLPLGRFVFAPAGLQGEFTATWALSSHGSCAGHNPTGNVHVTASTAADNAVGLVFTTSTATCMALGAYGFSDSTPMVEGGAQCTGLDGISTSPFTASDLHVGRDTLSFYLDFDDGKCGYYGPVVAARTDRLLDDSAPPHTDVSGLWKAGSRWSLDAHLQGNTLFAAVLAADGSWYVAPNARYMSGQDGDVVEYGGDLWSASKTRPSDRDYHLAPAGIMTLDADAGGYSAAGYGAQNAQAPVSRVTWPRDDRISGSYLGVRTITFPGADWVASGFDISEDAGMTRIKMGDTDANRCEFSGMLVWEGLTGRMFFGSGSCGDSQGTFGADEIRLTDQGLTLRYWLHATHGVAFGTIAGVRR